MRRLLHLVAPLMLAVMLWTGAAAHAAEAVGCIEVTSQSAGHFEGDDDQVPADSGKAAPHHHGGCHGHHVGVAGGAEPLVSAEESQPQRGRGACGVLPGAGPGQDLRPPIA